MEFNFIEIITLVAVIYLLSTIFRLEQRVKTLDYKVEQLSAQTDITEEGLYEELHQELKVLIHQGKDVQAVKRVRETKGLSLLEAKQYIDTLKLKEE
ncbi:hypothetical protein KP77_31490 [Jeotgalibacillus alimentarius]|uniref:Ribosomal protein L7/L12 C-terminal domain-containing protein n=1 Tax=Jeotgalibacillus alimentarius TaxID=135826 RepID=A0A0C2VHH9_9BACL|nr:hypothetical protein [Jeotgalibacillus alimentarius]KIL43443.1 hypothetical protein KP77_31490 [Jeotgalibacillus alimentarius]